MENNPNEVDTSQPVAIPAESSTPTVETDAVTEVPATEEPKAGEPDSSENSTSTTEEDLTSLIEEEKRQGKPDPEKARERFLESRQKEEPEEPDDKDKPLTRREQEEMLAEMTRNAEINANQDRIFEYSNNFAETPQEAELIREIHKNRVFPSTMSIRDQVAEAHAIANAKRIQAKNVELTRAVQHGNTVSRDTAQTHRDPQASPQPGLPADMETSLKRSGYVYNSQEKRYEKTLPNGTVIATTDGKNPQPVK
jgi:hypothetical protein